MRRRITEAIVGVSALILLVLGVPLAIAIHQSILDSEVVELQATAARTLSEIRVPTTVGEIVVATPITDHTTEQVVGALRLTESLAGANHRSRVAWLEMAATGLAALALGWLIAKRLARRLSQPVTDLAAAAARIGDGGALVRPATPSGVSEIDTLATALVDSSERINDALARERRFSADVSHQLRTPLTGIRLRLEAGRSQREPDMLGPALDDLHRLEQTVDHLLAFARDAVPATSTVRLDDAARHAAQQWGDRAAAAGRTITVTTSEPTMTRGSITSTEQILDVLIDNALHHGDGNIVITQRRIAGAAAIDGSDHGTHVDLADAERIFQRGQGERNGIGLALARSIAEAEGGRLILARRDP